MHCICHTSRQTPPLPRMHRPLYCGDMWPIHITKWGAGCTYHMQPHRRKIDRVTLWYYITRHWSVSISQCHPVIQILLLRMNDMEFLGIIFKVCIQQRWAHETFFLSPQSQFCYVKETLSQSQIHNFLKKCCSTTATLQLQFFLKCATWELHFCNSQHIFGCGIQSSHEKKSEIKNLKQLSL